MVLSGLQSGQKLLHPTQRAVTFNKGWNLPNKSPQSSVQRSPPSVRSLRVVLGEAAVTALSELSEKTMAMTLRRSLSSVKAVVVKMSADVVEAKGHGELAFLVFNPAVIHFLRRARDQRPHSGCAAFFQVGLLVSGISCGFVHGTALNAWSNASIINF